MRRRWLGTHPFVASVDAVAKLIAIAPFWDALAVLALEVVPGALATGVGAVFLIAGVRAIGRPVNTHTQAVILGGGMTGGHQQINLQMVPCSLLTSHT